MGLRFLLFVLLPLHVLAQDITGIWTGTLQTTAEKLKYEVAISEQGDKYIGYALTAFAFNGIENIGIKTIEVKIKSGRILLEDNELVYNNYSTPPKRIKLFGDMWLSDQGATLRMRGEFHTRTLDFRASDKTSYKGSIVLQKQPASSSTVLIKKLDELNLLASLSFMQEKEKAMAAVEKPKASEARKEPSAITPSKPAAAIAVRKTEVIRNISLTGDSLVLSLYDNGEVDGDTVSVVLNGKVIIANQALTTNAARTTIHITPDLGNTLQLILYAENLGSIAPNTGLLVLDDGKEKHEIRFAGDLQKSSAIILTRRR